MAASAMASKPAELETMEVARAWYSTKSLAKRVASASETLVAMRRPRCLKVVCDEASVMVRSPEELL